MKAEREVLGSMIDVVWLSYREETPPRGYWSYGLLDLWLDDVRLTHGLNLDEVPAGCGAIVVLPAEYHTAPEHVDRLNADLQKLPWVVLILASDECALYPVEDLLPHNQMSLWVMTPNFNKHIYPENTQFIGEGYPQDATALIAKFKSVSFDRKHVASFSGQLTHERRDQMVKLLHYAPHEFYVNPTAGFTQGLSREDYYRLLVDTKCTPAPSGPCTPDSFRAYETLEAGGVPILDAGCPDPQDGDLYWDAIFGIDHPIPVENWDRHALAAIYDVDVNWPMSSNLVFSWWQLHKRSVRQRIFDGVPGLTHGRITVLISTSPIPSHPSTAIIDETIASVRFHLPDADILVLCDGVRPEQEDRREAYERYVQEVCWKANFDWDRVYPIVSAEWLHQAGMLRVGLDHVRTPLVLFVEHDTPLVTDCPIDWDGIMRLVESELVHLVRLHHEAHVHIEHEHLTIDREPIDLLGVPVRRTHQFSMRPHVAGLTWYQRMVQRFFPLNARTMVEDRFHSAAQEFPDEFRIAIYHPPQNIKRSLHLDGRGDDPKFEMDYGCAGD